MRVEWIVPALRFGLGIALLWFVITYRQRDSERFRSAYRLALKLVIACLLFALVPRVSAYVDLVVGTTRLARRVTESQRKMTTSALEAELMRAGQFAPSAGLRCAPTEGGWDYACSYMPTPLQSRTRVQFGVSVDERRRIDVSRIVPAEANLPPRRP